MTIPDPQPKHQKVSDDTTGGGLKPSVILDKAADLITPEGAWTQGSLGRNEAGYPCGFPYAASRCAEGAIAAIVGRYCGGAYSAPDGYLMKVVGMVPCTFNDAPERTKPEVIAALRQAAELAREDGQ